MKHKLLSYGMIGLLACGSSIAYADLLSNGNLETTAIGPQTLATPVGWNVNARLQIPGTPFSFTDGCSSEGFAQSPPPTVGTMGLFFKPFQGNVTNTITVDFYQDNPATPGATYLLTGWAGAEANYSGLIPGGPTKSLLELRFLDAANNDIGGVNLDLLAAGLGVVNGQPFNYKQYSVLATAPAGAVTVRADASMINAYNNPLGGGQAFVVDTFSLVIPEPSIAALLGFGFLTMLLRRRQN